MSCPCPVCHKHVKKNYRKLKCITCNCYVHKCCSNITNKEFRRGDITKFWHCSTCNEIINLPFNHILDDSEFLLKLYRVFEDKNIVKEENKN